MTEWSRFFPSGTSVVALPSWDSPRLFIPAQTLSSRWQLSRFYPAFRLRGRLYRLLLRTRAAASLAPARQAVSPGWELATFVQDVLPETTAVSVLMGTPGPAQKITVQCWNAENQVVGYVKYAEQEAARRRLRHEYEVLTKLPRDVGPRALKFDAWSQGEALLQTPIEGTSPSLQMPPPNRLVRLAQRLVRDGKPHALETHPWYLGHAFPEALNPWLDVLSSRRWPVVVQHGDLVSWNLVRRPDGEFAAIDWEYARLDGFPHLDLVYYILQLASHVFSWSPQRAAEYAADYLLSRRFLELSPLEAHALVRLSAYDAYVASETDEDDPELLAWRRTIWEGAA